MKFSFTLKVLFELPLVKEAARLAGIHKNISSHSMRHCFATYLLESGVDIRTVQELMGHSDVRTTMIYTHVLKKPGIAVDFYRTVIYTVEIMNMDLFEAINKRCSYRGHFLESEIPESHLVKIVQAGIQAPSGKNKQTTHFVIINKQELVKKIAGICNYSFIDTARAIILCIIPRRKPFFNGRSYAVEDCAAAAENMLLAITALGYASVWIDGDLRIMHRAQKIGQLINLPPGKKVRIILPVGVPEKPAFQKPKKPFGERAWFGSYPSRNAQGKNIL